MTSLYRATAIDVPTNPFEHGPGHEGLDALRIEHDAGIVVNESGIIIDRGPFGAMCRDYPEAQRTTLDGYLFPGLVDAHVHLPQVRALGGVGRPLLEWLHETALPAEERMSDAAHARSVADETLHNLAASGTTSALVFGSHYSSAMDIFFNRASTVGLRITSGLVVSDVNLTNALHTTPEQALEESLSLIHRWHGVGRVRYAVTPRFALSCTAEMLASCAEVLAQDRSLFFTTHVNENAAEISAVAELHPEADSYVGVYDRHHLLAGSAVLAHNVRPRPSELTLLAARRTAIAHCPTSNSALGSGMFPMGRHVEARIPLALGSDVGAGGGFGVLKEALQAVYAQQLLATTSDAADAYALSVVHALWLATKGGALSLGLPDVGCLSVGSPFDAVHLSPAPHSDASIAAQHIRRNLAGRIDDPCAPRRRTADLGSGRSCALEAEVSALIRSRPFDFPERPPQVI